MADGHDDIDDDQGGDHDGPYGQPLRDYAFRSESLFAESMRPRQKPAGGLKVHLSVAEEDVFQQHRCCCRRCAWWKSTTRWFGHPPCMLP